MRNQVEVKVVEEEDPDFGTVLKVTLDGEPLPGFVRASESDAESTILKRAVADLFFQANRSKHMLDDYYELRKALAKAVGI